ncbi:hypothetical protein ACIQ9Q_13720 [Streptomyces sp. NPDC094438]|uniref:hypothetical protein n=1 Tax=Streptomyces sp. NPDC094438 TaxID=3366061 RepID=UPI00381B618D
MKSTGPHRALVYLNKERMHLMVTPLDAEAGNTAGDPDWNPVRFLVHRDLGPAEEPFTPALFAHRLVEAGYTIGSAELIKPDTVNGWSKGVLPDRWRTVCYPTASTTETTA